MPTEEQKNPHGEDEPQENLGALQEAAEIKSSEQAHIEVEEVALIDDPKQILKDLTEKFDELQPLSDALLNDGELTTEQEDVFLEALLVKDEETESNIQAYMEVSEETKQYLENMEKSLPHLEDNPVVLLNHIGRVMREMEPLQDELFAEGDSATEEQMQAESEETAEEVLIMDEEVSAAELDEVKEDIFGEMEALQDLIGADPTFKELLEELA